MENEKQTKMILTIYKNGEKVNKIIENKKSEVYKQLAIALFHGYNNHNHNYNTEKIKYINYLNNDLSFSRFINIYDFDENGAPVIVYKYEYAYSFENVKL